MDVTILDKKPRFYISSGDVLFDSMSTNDTYLIVFSSFNETNKTLYKLLSLSGDGKCFSQDELNEKDIKELIISNRLIHYSNSEYELKLEKKTEGFS